MPPLARRPLVSGVIIFLNERAFLQEAIDSVLAQTHPHWELLLVDDGSRDGSREIALRAAASDPARITYLEHPAHRNKGMSASRNLGLAAAQGDYVAFLDGDDVWLPCKLQRQLAALEERPDIDVIYGSSLLWYGWSGDATRDRERGVGVAPGTVFRPPELMKRCYPLGDAPSPTTCSMLIRRSTIEHVGGFESAFTGLFEEQAFLAKLYLGATILVTGDCLDKYRQHAGSCVARAASTGEIDGAEAAFLEWLRLYVAQQDVKDRDIHQRTRVALARHRFAAFRRLLTRSNATAAEMGHGAWRLWNQSARLCTGKSTGRLTVHPKRLITTDRYGFVDATLQWHSRGTAVVELRRESPNGSLVIRTGASGSVGTGLTAGDGNRYYLQDVSDGRPLTFEHTLDAVRLSVVRPPRVSTTKARS